MAFGDKFKNIFSMPEEYGDEFDMEEEENEEEEAKDVRSSGFSFNRSRSEDDGKVVDIHSSGPAASQGSVRAKIVLCKVESLDTISAIGTHINEKKVVLLNLENCPSDITQRVIDVISGVSFANNSEMSRIADNVYIITPYNVPLSGDMFEGIDR